MLPSDDPHYFPPGPSFTDIETFFTAAKNGDASTVARLLDDYGATIINARDSINARALTWAACNGHLEVVELLLDRGAPIDAKGTAGKPALIWAAEMGKPDVAALLLERGAGLEERDDSGTTALEHANRTGHYDIAGLIEQQAEARRAAQQQLVDQKEQAEVRNLTLERLEKLKKLHPQHFKLSAQPQKPEATQTGNSKPSRNENRKPAPKKPQGPGK